jgi:hypothetical protein
LQPASFPVKANKTIHSHRKTDLPQYIINSEHQLVIGITDEPFPMAIRQVVALQYGGCGVKTSLSRLASKVVAMPAADVYLLVRFDIIGPILFARVHYSEPNDRQQGSRYPACLTLSPHCVAAPEITENNTVVTTAVSYASSPNRLLGISTRGPTTAISPPSHFNDARLIPTGTAARHH